MTAPATSNRVPLLSAALGVWAFLMLISPVPVRGAELLLLEQPGCVWCARFDAEVALGYPHTVEGRRAPLRRIDITQIWPGDLAKILPERLTPTFILVNDAGEEVARLKGYPGDHFIWPMLSAMIAKLDPGQTN